LEHKLDLVSKELRQIKVVAQKICFQVSRKQDF
jgi:hypothetical protein